MRGAEIQLAWPENHVIQSVKAEPDGHFRIETKEDGFFFIQFTSAGHIRGEEPTLLEPRTKLTIRARLAVQTAPGQVSAAVIEFSDPTSEAARFASAYERMMERREAFSQAYQAFRATGRPMADFNCDYATDRTEIEHALSNERAPLVRQMLFLSYLDLGYGSNGAEIEASWGRRALSEVPPISPLWELEPEWVSVAARAAGPAVAEPYIRALLAEHPDAKLRSEIRRELGPDGKIRVGAKLPQFEVQLFREPGKTLTTKDLLRKVYLVDFWATWCQPCVDEIPNMQDAYQLYERDGFEILSVSFDDTPQTVEKFQRERHAMPWQNAMATGGFSGEIAKDFELTGLPSPILVDRSGTIIAIGMDARGRRLLTTLQRQLHEP